MEDLQKVVTPTERTLMLKEACLTDFTVGQVRSLIADMVEMAYLAGANHLEIRGSHRHAEGMQTTGEIIVKARNYVKDKGLRI